MAFGPDGLADGDNPGNARYAISGGASQPWSTQWYATPQFGMLKHGTGLLLDLGGKVTVSSVVIDLGEYGGASLEIRAGNGTAPQDLRVAATASNVGGVVRLTLPHPVAARYLLIWFTQLPPDGAGHYRDRLPRPGHRAPLTTQASAGHTLGAVQSDSPLVGVVMGSDSDWPVMGAAAEVLDEFGVPYEADVVSAHRMPREMIAYGEQAASRGLKVIIAGAGGAAHLPGMLASVTPLPVIGVPVPLKHMEGLDSLLSIVQMPAGIPVATVAVGGARNAGLLAVRILAAADDDLRAQMIEFQARLTAQAKAKGAALRDQLG